MRAVLDTNVVVSAFRSRRGASYQVMSKAASGRFRMIVSSSLFLEYEEVLKRPEHRIENELSVADIDRALLGLAAIAEPADIHFLWRPQTRDPDDEMILEAAVNGQARRIVTVNISDFGAAGRFGIGVVTPQIFLGEIAQ